MKKIIFGIFAHPDDEAFGPAGTFLLETRSGTELHLITLTNGEAGMNPDSLTNLGEARLNEWRQAGKMLGASTMSSFGYKDSHLNNQDMIEIGNRLVDYVTSTLQATQNDCIIEFMTLDLNGMTGHIDHIVAARAATYAFYKLKEADDRLSRIRFACLPRKLSPVVNTDWIFMDAGHLPEEINEIIDARSIRNDILAIMQIHHSQRGDYASNIAQQGDDLGLNYFIVKN